MKASFKKILQLYLSGAFVYLIGIIIINYLPYYQDILNARIQNIFIYIYLTYLIIAPVYYYFFSTRYSENKPLLFLRGIKRVFTKFRLKEEEKMAILFMGVKIFFLPLMIKFCLGNYGALKNMTDNFMWYPFALTLIFTLDTIVFTFGYTFEFKSLNNVVKSVEPTLFGWVVALICYPPFNGMVGKHIPWGASDYAHFWTPEWTIFFQIILLGFLLTYLWATFALGPKASNLTNRGIVSRFPYSIVRHPAYISKNLVWWITMIPIINWKFALGMSFWTLIYFFRAITEERHLLKDPDYVKYCKKVKWRFIPYIY
jgi:protein-S-isoprenylcysteine O-methyltransferase Ste14